MAKNYRCDICASTFTNLIDLNYHWLDCGQRTQEDEDYEWLQKERSNSNKNINLSKESNVAFLLLKPSPKQKKQLDQLFSGPQLVARLLREKNNVIRSKDEASFFLLRNKEALEPFLFTQNRNRAVDLLKSLILQWSGRPPTDFEIYFEANCSISAMDQIFFPIDYLGLLNVTEPKILQEYKRNARYIEKFSLIYKEKEFYVKIPFFHKKDKVINKENKCTTTANKVISRQPLINNKKTALTQVFNYRNFLEIFNHRIEKNLRLDLKVSKALKTVQFDSLSGRSVQGGLPSLGKRR